MATTNYSWNLPTVGGSENTWGTSLNANWTALDTLLGGVSATEFAILDGATVTTAELNILDGVTATTAELNILDGVTWTLTDLNGITAAGKALLDDADAAAQRTTLGLGGLATVNILDEDDFSSNSATRPPSQQSTKAYVDNKSSRVFLASQDASSSATLDFTQFDSSKYDAYEFVLANVKPSTDSVSLRIRTSTDGGSNYDDGASDYKFASVLTVPGGANNVGSSGDTSVAGAGTSGGDTVGNAAGEDGVSGVVMVLGPHLTAKTRIQGQTTFDRASDGNVTLFSFGGFRNAAADVDAIRFLFSSGNIASGTITMYGLRNS